MNREPASRRGAQLKWAEGQRRRRRREKQKIECANVQQWYIMYRSIFAPDYPIIDRFRRKVRPADVNDIFDLVLTNFLSRDAE